MDTLALPKTSCGKSELEMMLAKVAVCGIVLFCLLWTEDVEAGSSFLSPSDMQKNAGKKLPKKLPYTMSRREAVDSWGNPVDEHSEDQEEIGVTIPLDINLKLTQEQFKRQKAAIENLLLGLFSLGSAQGTQEEKA
ncbi:ghrelin-like isoform X2 [Hyla sarda]|uniref:ghrelin-like isoform X2 n=1 Tax=Hyla sarda TaxID=327740 RepID=UPI0024C4598A|nr:ghrelin-like isoform X2 [Hyla sarda]